MDKGRPTWPRGEAPSETYFFDPMRLDSSMKLTGNVLTPYNIFHHQHGKKALYFFSFASYHKLFNPHTIGNVHFLSPP